MDAEAVFCPRLEKPIVAVAVAEDFTGVGQRAVRRVATSPTAIRNGENFAVTVDAGVCLAVELEGGKRKRDFTWLLHNHVDAIIGNLRAPSAAWIA